MQADFIEAAGRPFPGTRFPTECETETRVRKPSGICVPFPFHLALVALGRIQFD
jgi:hypothetical protein